jgi:DNA-binding transcriptional LysR family regulator
MFPPGSFPANLHLEIKTAPTRVIFDDLYDDRLDLGVVTEVAADRVPSGLIGIPLFELDMALIMHPSHKLAAKKGAIDIALLMEEPIIMNELSIGYGQIVSAMFNDLGMRPRIRAIVDNVETIKVMVQTGAGVAVIPAGAAEMEVTLGLLTARPISPARRIIINAYRSRQALSRRKEGLIQQIIEPSLERRTGAEPAVR